MVQLTVPDLALPSPQPQARAFNKSEDHETRIIVICLCVGLSAIAIAMGGVWWWKTRTRRNGESATPPPPPDGKVPWLWRVPPLGFSRSSSSLPVYRANGGGHGVNASVTTISTTFSEDGRGGLGPGAVARDANGVRKRSESVSTTKGSAVGGAGGGVGAVGR
ncbi:hypothetical protein JCM6882_008279 [Rhodosporidiobolus microsporus]